MTIEEINNLTDEQLLELMRGPATEMEIAAYRQLLLDGAELNSLRDRIGALEHHKDVFKRLNPSIPNFEFEYHQMMVRKDLVELRAYVDAVEAEEIAYKAELNAKASEEANKKAAIDAFKAADNATITEDQIKDVLKAIL